MASVPPKPSGKGVPPQPLNMVGNLDKPESEDMLPLNFKPPAAFKREYKLFAAQIGKTMLEVLQESFELYKATQMDR